MMTNECLMNSSHDNVYSKIIFTYYYLKSLEFKVSCVALWLNGIEDEAVHTLLGEESSNLLRSRYFVKLTARCLKLAAPAVKDH